MFNKTRNQNRRGDLQSVGEILQELVRRADADPASTVRAGVSVRRVPGGP
jgi:hypothetical protein